MAIKSRLLRLLHRNAVNDAVAALRAADAELTAQHIDDAWSKAFDEVDREVGSQEGAEPSSRVAGFVYAPTTIALTVVAFATIAVALKPGLAVGYSLATGLALLTALIILAQHATATGAGTTRDNRARLGRRVFGNEHDEHAYQDGRSAKTALHRP